MRTLKPTTALSVRINHTTLATLLEFYARKDIEVGSQASLVRTALEDFSRTLVVQGLSIEYDVEAALERLGRAKCTGQSSRRSLLVKELAAQLDISTDRPTEKVSTKDVEELVKLFAASQTPSSLQNSTKPENDEGE